MFLIQVLVILLSYFAHYSNEPQVNVANTFIASHCSYQNADQNAFLHLDLAEIDGEEENLEAYLAPLNNFSEIFTSPKVEYKLEAPFTYASNKNAWRFTFIPKFILHQSYLI